MTMTKKYEDISNALNVDTEIISAFEETKNEIQKIDTNHLDKDYEYVRGNLFSLIEKGQESINTIMEIAQEGEHPRAFEVVGQLIKTVADITDKLIDLQKKMKDLNQDTVKGPTNVTNNALFVGSTSELQKLIKEGLLNNKED